jgi:hypothetical protein
VLIILRDAAKRETIVRRLEDLAGIDPVRA